MERRTTGPVPVETGPAMPTCGRVTQSSYSTHVHMMERVEIEVEVKKVRGDHDRQKSAYALCYVPSTCSYKGPHWRPNYPFN